MVKNQMISRTDYGITFHTNGHKKRGSAESQPFVNLKSNTMKNIAKIRISR